MPLRPIVSCEHGGHEVPAEVAHLFAGHEEALTSHRGWDPGALALAERLAGRLGVPLVAARTTRLLVDLNRSADNPDVLGEPTRPLPAAEGERLLAEHWWPHRRRVEDAVAAAAAGGTAVHLAVHTFTPVLGPEVRDFDLGLLFEPSREREAALAAAIRRALAAVAPELAVRDNEPYLGIADGLTTHLRRRFAADRYLGLELEVNQRHPLGDPGGWEQMQRAITEALARALAPAG
jgi:predicted N-formylglutamate amidohydrolase